ncbi:MAG: hypothetical protein ACD_77C00032G0001, partial [uncultured bacterium]
PILGHYHFRVTAVFGGNMGIVILLVITCMHVTT